jgi:hypothetical protein
LFIETIYVKILNEGTTVWRPVKAEKILNNVFKIIDFPEHGEKWEFSPNTKVICALQEKSVGMVYVAVEKCPEMKT